MGTKPAAKSKSVFQKGVRLTVVGFSSYQAFKNRLGPVPKTGSALKTAFPIFHVATQSGFASRYEILSFVEVN